MNAANVELTQVVSQMSGPPILSVSDDLLQTPRMTIEGLIESTQKCYGSVLAWACEFDMEAGWFYQACTKCASRINFVSGQLYCDKCKMPRTAVPRYKVHLQVIDDTGSITFVMFDRVVFQVVGLTAQDLLDAMNNDPSSPSYPKELDMFVNKWMLFKVEVTDANFYRNWRGYNVKKVTSDEDIIKRFTSLHGINLNDHDDDTDFDHLLFELGDIAPLPALDGVESSNKADNVVSNSGQTPTSKMSGKQKVGIDGCDVTASGRSTARRVIDLDQDDAALLDMDNPSTSKFIGKGITNIDENQVVTTNQDNRPCVKIPDAK
ncbi:uncharacterized protein LOC123892275 [Trifolium pratense]|uniref:uncharacterized protein LOC123892275 n=1 Tax=Trifolium pratense TaxID=57577 RepID=UPI001E690212|nr:uncharacterized protein LOC123892275 [Trifolium pratense]